MFPSVEWGRKTLKGIPDEHINKLLATQLQFNPDYYRIVDLTNVDEETKEMDERLSQSREGLKRKNT